MKKSELMSTCRDKYDVYDCGMCHYEFTDTCSLRLEIIKNEMKKMSKYLIKVLTEIDKNCYVEEYFRDIDENGSVVLTEDLGKAALFDNEETCDSIIDHLYILLDYMPRTIEKKKMFYVNPKF